MNINEKSKVSAPAYTIAGMVLAWLLYLTHSLEAVKTDLAIIKATVLTAHRATPDSSLAKSNK